MQVLSTTHAVLSHNYYVYELSKISVVFKFNVYIKLLKNASFM